MSDPSDYQPLPQTVTPMEPSKPIPHSVTIWAALAVLLATLLRAFGIVADSHAIESVILAIVQVVGPLLIVWRRYVTPQLPLRGWRKQSLFPDG